MDGYRKRYAKWSKSDKDKYCVISSIHVIQDTKQMKNTTEFWVKLKKKKKQSDWK